VGTATTVLDALVGVQDWVRAEGVLKWIVESRDDVATSPRFLSILEGSAGAWEVGQAALRSLTSREAVDVANALPLAKEAEPAESISSEVADMGVSEDIDGSSEVGSDANAVETHRLHRGFHSAALSDMTVVKLKDLAKRCGLSGYSKLRKNELVVLILADGNEDVVDQVLLSSA